MASETDFYDSCVNYSGEDGDNWVEELLKDNEIPCDMCGEIMNDFKSQCVCRVLDDDSEFPETIMVGPVSEYDYYTICRECHNISARQGKHVKWCIRRSEFERFQHERSLPTIKQPED